MDIRNNQTQELFEKLYVKNAPSWALERDSDGSYKYHATQSAFSLFEQQQAEIELLKSDLAKAQAVPEGYVLMPIKPTETMVMAVVKEHEGDAFLPYSLYDAYVKQAMIEAQEPAND
ncbi:hypothetical protein [Acinetobacter sp. YH12105]|uniref:hypothetical protein n=1 Tax=Acinetobacter sp. YH12105 TaxID=2601093 RepID=UPI0015D3A13F|nr:hypothetical protein [Acinetobacter sp. YH12105]